MTRWMQSRPAHDPMCGRSVRPQTLPRPAHQTPVTAPHDAWAVGAWDAGIGVGGGGDHELIEHWNGHRWANVSPSFGGRARSYLLAVTSRSANDAMGDGRQTPPTTERADGPLGWLPLEHRTQSQRLTRSSHNAALRRHMGRWQHRQPPENPRNALQACTSARQRRRCTRPVSLARTPPLTSTRTRRRRPADRRPPTRHGQARSRRPCPGRSHPRTRHRG